MVLPNQDILHRRYVGFIAILLLAFALRMWDINARSLWFDEAVEYWSANAPLGALPKTVLAAYQPPLYTYLLHIWLKFGMEAVWLRFLSVTLSMLTIVGVIAWGHRLFGLRGALIAGGITAMLPSEVRYAQEIGEYALMECALTWALNFLDRVLRSPRWRSWGLWGFFTVVSVYSHYGTSIVAVPVAAISLVENLWRKRQQAIFQQVVVMTITLMLGLPLLAHFLPRQIQGPIHHAFTPGALSFSTEVVRFADSIMDTFLFQVTGWPFSTLPKWIGQMGVAVILAMSLCILVSPLAGVQKRALSWLLVAYISYFASVRSGLYAYGNYGFRYGLILAPLFVLSVVAVIEQLIGWRQTLISYAVFSAILGLGAYSLPNRTLSQLTRGEQLWPETEDLRQVTWHWMEHRNGTDPTYVYYGAVPAFRYYLRLYGVDTDPLPPSWYSACWRREADEVCSTNNVFYGEWFRLHCPEEKLLSMQKTLGDNPKHLWLIFSHVHPPGEDNTILERLLEQYIVVTSYERTNASAYLLELR